MWIDKLTSSSTLTALELSARFAEQRQRVLAENLANIDTPDYRTRQLDPAAFRASLRAALTRAHSDGTASLDLRGNAQFATNADGGVTVRPATEPAQNVLFHDGTSARLERLMTDVNENALSYEMASNLLRARLENLLRAIRGRTT